MPRNASGVYTLPVAAYVAGTTIRSADMNSNLSDIATALTQSLATTGVTPMTGPLLAASGTLAAPSYAFSGATGTGWYLSGANQIGIVTNGTLAVTISATQTSTWVGAATFNASVSVGTTLGVTGAATFSSTITVNGTGTHTIGAAGAVVSLAGGVFIVATASVNTTLYIDSKANVDPASPAATYIRYYNKVDGFGTGQRPFAKDENGLIFPILANLGQCRLTKSGANLALAPYLGNRLLINGVPQIVPDAGITLAASNTAVTFVYIYAFMSGATMTLEMSTTAPTTQTGTGMKQKTGDATRTLVGAAYTDTGGAWADTDGKLWVISYFNRKPKISKTTIVASLGTTSGTYVEVDSGMRNQFISWNDEYVFANGFTWQSNISTGVQTIFSQVNIDGSTSLGSGYCYYPGSASGTYGANYPSGKTTGLTEAAVHYATLFMRATVVTSYICSIGVSAGESTFIMVTVQG